MGETLDTLETITPDSANKFFQYVETLEKMQQGPCPEANSLIRRLREEINCGTLTKKQEAMFLVAMQLAASRQEVRK